MCRRWNRRQNEKVEKAEKAEKVLAIFYSTTQHSWYCMRIPHTGNSYSSHRVNDKVWGQGHSAQNLFVTQDRTLSDCLILLKPGYPCLVVFFRHRRWSERSGAFLYGNSDIFDAQYFTEGSWWVIYNATSKDLPVFLNVDLTVERMYTVIRTEVRRTVPKVQVVCVPVW